MPLHFIELRYVSAGPGVEMGGLALCFSKSIDSESKSEDFATTLADFASELQDIVKHMSSELISCQVAHTSDGKIAVCLPKEFLYRVLYSVELRIFFKKQISNFYDIYQCGVKTRELVRFILKESVSSGYVLRNFYKVLAHGTDTELGRFWKFTHIEKMIEQFETYFDAINAKREIFVPTQIELADMVEQSSKEEDLVVELEGRLKLPKSVAKINTKNSVGGTAAMFAAMKGFTKVARLLLQHRADFKIQSEVNKNTALNYAIRYERTEMVVFLVDEAKVGLDLLDAKGRTALMYAEQEIRLPPDHPIVKKLSPQDPLLAEQKAELVAPVVAVSHTFLSRIGTVKDLPLKEILTKPAVRLEKTRHRLPEAEEVLKSNHRLKAQLQMEEKEILDALPEKLDGLDILKMINDQDESGYTLVMYAAAKGFVQLLRKLLSIQDAIDFNAQNKLTGYTALMYAVEVEQIDVVTFFLERNIKFDVIDNFGETAIIKAAVKYNAAHPICVGLSSAMKMIVLPDEQCQRYYKDLPQKIDLLPQYVLGKKLSIRSQVNRCLFAFYKILQNNNLLFANEIIKMQHKHFNLKQELEDFERYFLKRQQDDRRKEEEKNDEVLIVVSKASRLIFAEDQMQLREYSLNIIGEEREQEIAAYCRCEGKEILWSDFILFFDAVDDIIGELDSLGKIKPVDSWVIEEVLRLLHDENFIKEVGEFISRIDQSQELPAEDYIPEDDIRTYSDRVIEKMEYIQKDSFQNNKSKAKMLNFYSAVLHKDKKKLQYLYDLDGGNEADDLEVDFEHENLSKKADIDIGVSNVPKLRS